MGEAQKSSKPTRTSTPLVSDNERLDALMIPVYGCTLNEWSARLYEAGVRDGKKEGYSAGRRRAKGLKPAKAHGRPFEIDKGLRALMSSEVDCARMSGTLVKQAIEDFLKKMRLGNKLVRMQLRENATPCELPTAEKAKAAYYRDRKRTVPVSSF